MDHGWTRREFLERTGGSLAAFALAPLLPGRPSAPFAAGSGRTAPAHAPAGRLAADLPPRVVGLRTLGGDFRFDPPGLRVEPGAGVTWLNMGDFHTTTSFHPEYNDLLAGDVPLRIPEGAEPWHSGMLGLSAGTQFTHTFGVPGVYDYFCQPHYSFGMVGRIVAGSPRGGPAVTRPISELNEASRERLPRVETIMGPGGRAFEWASRLNGILLVASSDGDAAGAAGAVAAGIDGDARLRELVSAAGSADRLRSRVDAVAAGAREGVPYQELLGRIDAAKDVLDAAR